MCVQHILQQSGAGAWEAGKLRDSSRRSEVLVRPPSAEMIGGDGFSKALQVTQDQVRMTLKDLGMRNLDVLALSHAPHGLFVVAFFIGERRQSGPGLRAGDNVGL